MLRFFFDYVSRDQTLLDYRGDVFPSSGSAIDFADEIAQNLMHSLSNNWNGWSIEVRSPEGHTIYKAPIGMPELCEAQREEPLLACEPVKAGNIEHNDLSAQYVAMLGLQSVWLTPGRHGRERPS